MLEKRNKTCSSCETKYTVEWDIEVQDLRTINLSILWTRSRGTRR
jgi:hypothetical protein